MNADLEGALRAKIQEQEKRILSARSALAGLYALRGGMEKPVEHRPTREALRAAELVLFGTSHL